MGQRPEKAQRYCASAQQPIQTPKLDRINTYSLKDDSLGLSVSLMGMHAKVVNQNMTFSGQQANPQGKNYIDPKG